MSRIWLRRHIRFLSGIALAVLVFMLAPLPVMPRLLWAVDGLFAVYLGTTALQIWRMGNDDLARHARAEDEGLWLILALALLAVGVSLVAIFAVLSGGEVGRVHRIAALVSIPLGWITLHTLFAFRYAHQWYGPDIDPHDDVVGARGGLDFPGTDQRRGPGVWEFLYYSFTIGMTAQTSDTGATTTEMRRLTLLQAVISFFYNTVLIALAVNAALSGG